MRSRTGRQGSLLTHSHGACRRETLTVRSRKVMKKSRWVAFVLIVWSIVWVLNMPAVIIPILRQAPTISTHEAAGVTVTNPSAARALVEGSTH